MKKKNKIVVKDQPQVTLHAPEKAKEKKLVPQYITSKTYLVPRKVYPRWSGSVDEFGGRFSGELALGNGTVCQIGCFFDAQRHFWVVLPTLQAGAVFPAGKKTTAAAVQAALTLESEGDARNLSDFTGWMKKITSANMNFATALDNIKI
jgi:hypothetical protein